MAQFARVGRRLGLDSVAKEVVSSEARTERGSGNSMKDSVVRSELLLSERPAAPDEPIAFFARMAQAFAYAGQQAGRIERWFSIGDYRLQLVFAGQSLLERVCPALQHLAIPDPPPRTAADLSVGLWDSASTGVQPPSPSWGPDDYLDRGSIRGFNTDRIRTAYYVGAGVFAMLDHQRRQAVYWLRDAADHPLYLTGSPLLPILHWWMEAKGCQLVHAGAVGNPDGGVLLVGRGGSGKSTSTLACLESDLLFLAEDYCLLGQGPKHVIYSLYCSAKVDANSLDLLPHLRFLATGAPIDDAGKALFFLGDSYGDSLARALPLVAVLLPKVSGKRDTTLNPVSGIQALRSLAPSTVFQLPGGGHQAFGSMAASVRHTPCYVLETGTDVAQIPFVISRLLAELAA